MEEIEAYTIIANRMEVKVSITKEEDQSKKYFLILPQIKEATAALLDHIKGLIVSETMISSQEITDPKAVANLKLKFRTRAEQLLKKSLPQITQETSIFLVSLLIHETFRFHKI